MIKTVTLDRNQKPTAEQIKQIEEAAKIARLLHRQWKRRSGWRQKTVTHREKQLSLKFFVISQPDMSVYIW